MIPVVVESYPLDELATTYVPLIVFVQSHRQRYRYTPTEEKGVRDASRGHALSELRSECSSACAKDNDAHTGQAVTFFHAETVARTAAGQGRGVVMIGLGPVLYILGEARSSGY